ncbi:MAG: hypothetical protein K2Y01_05145 [Rhabdochlamydiaceae bacterium]|nr:hypothetical protein [Rhabdochlamydiaceae bacterium]
MINEPADIYSLKPPIPPNKDSVYYKCLKALFTSSPVLKGAAIGLAIGYCREQTLELTTAGALAGAVVILPGAAYGAALSAIPYYVQYVERVPQNNAPNSPFKRRVAEWEKFLKETTKLSARTKHIGLLALGITATYYFLPDSWSKGAVNALPSTLTNFPKNLQTWANTPAIDPGIEELAKWTANTALFFSNMTVTVAKVTAGAVGFFDFQKLVVSSALVVGAAKAAESIGKFRVMQPITKYVQETIKKPGPLCDLLACIGTSLTMISFSDYLKDLQKAAATEKNLFTDWQTYFPTDLSKTSTTWGDRWTQFTQIPTSLSDYWNNVEPNSPSIGDQLYTWWDQTFVAALKKSATFEIQTESETPTISSDPVSTTPPSLWGNAGRYAELSIPSILKYGAIPLLAAAVTAHIAYRYYCPPQRELNPALKKATTLDDVVTLVNQLKTSISENYKDLLDYFPVLKRNILRPLYENLNRAANDDEINIRHGRIMHAINEKITQLKTDLTRLNTDPMNKFKAESLLIKAFELKLQELDYRFETPAHPAAFGNRPSIVLLAQAHALQETGKLYKDQITLTKELRNDLENMEAPKSTMDLVSGFLNNLEKAKAIVDTKYRDKIAELNRAFPPCLQSNWQPRVEDWEKTLDGIFDGNQITLSYFQPRDLRLGEDFRPINIANLTANAQAWVNGLPVATKAAFLNDPAKTLPKLTPAQRNALRGLTPAEIGELRLELVDTGIQIFPIAGAGHPVAGPDANELLELQRIML